MNNELSGKIQLFGKETKDPPTNIMLSNDRISIKQPKGSIIATLNASDPDKNESFVFSLVSGKGDDDNSFFNISEN